MNFLEPVHRAPVVLKQTLGAGENMMSAQWQYRGTCQPFPLRQRKGFGLAVKESCLAPTGQVVA